MEDKIKIQSSIPVPGPRGKWGELVAKMSVGDSVLLSRIEAMRFQQTVHNNFRRYRVTMRKEAKDEHRCWLLMRGNDGRRKIGG